MAFAIEKEKELAHFPRKKCHKASVCLRGEWLKRYRDKRNFDLKHPAPRDCEFAIHQIYVTLRKDAAGRTLFKNCAISQLQKFLDKV